MFLKNVLKNDWTIKKIPVARKCDGIFYLLDKKIFVDIIQNKKFKEGEKNGE